MIDQHEEKNGLIGGDNRTQVKPAAQKTAQGMGRTETVCQPHLPCG